jgi:alkylhydroperoxidase/carboxymuconolactone decarboxylase family protein YurZ
VEYTEVLRLLAINDERFGIECLTEGSAATAVLAPKALALVRLGAVIAVGGTVPSYGAETDAAISAGATTAEIVQVLVAVASIVGLPTAVAAAPRLAIALGYDVDDPLEQRESAF